MNVFNTTSTANNCPVVVFRMMLKKPMTAAFRHSPKRGISNIKNQTTKRWIRPPADADLFKQKRELSNKLSSLFYIVKGLFTGFYFFLQSKAKLPSPSIASVAGSGIANWVKQKLNSPTTGTLTTKAMSNTLPTGTAPPLKRI